MKTSAFHTYMRIVIIYLYLFLYVCVCVCDINDDIHGNDIFVVV